ncbi:radical SAM family heme chaperone HemW [Culicoidibacter larvae]|uniref:radical SAM family heme chaperone HemW n=1 Tax=Culicoidibacter larvae TaxID=2579976 RepID=UPI001485045C|nr:radical SAM family heme chaperone HemW [Culicoidibacter larvae]
MIDALYIHIPFCNQICTYCDFSKIYYANQARHEYITQLHRELALLLPEARPLRTVYFGGGTPSSMDLEELEYLFSAINPFIGENTECTFEANPESLTFAKLEFLRQAGVNRLSIGVQTFDEERLQLLGRTHSRSDVERCISDAKRAGFTNINIDFIYALPKQTLADLQKDISHFLDLEVTHISTYALIVEPHTVFGIGAKQGWFSETDEELQFVMYSYVQEALQEAGYEHYEVSNFAKPGFESRHNLTYWNADEYYGIGLGAHGYIAGVRYGNTRSINKYIAMLEQGERPLVAEERLSQQAQMEEFVFLGLRKREGIDPAEFGRRFNTPFEEIYGDIVARFIATEKLEVVGGYIRLAQEGIFVSNEVLQAFLLD